MSEKEALLPTKRIFGDCCRNTGHFLCGVERIKRFVNVHVHRQQPEKDKQNVDFTPLGKNSAEAHVCARVQFVR